MDSYVERSLVINSIGRGLSGRLGRRSLFSNKVKSVELIHFKIYDAALREAATARRFVVLFFNPMNDNFKRELATILLICNLLVAFVLFFMVSFAGWNPDGPDVSLMGTPFAALKIALDIFFGPFTVVIYIAFRRTGRSIYLYSLLISFMAIMTFSLVSLLNS
jgi:hypothetical protein